MAYCFTNKSLTHQNNILITGNNSTQAITGLGFQPDMIWTKKRNGAANHLLYDVAIDYKVENRKFKIIKTGYYGQI